MALIVWPAGTQMSSERQLHEAISPSPLRRQEVTPIDVQFSPVARLWSPLSPSCFR